MLTITPHISLKSSELKFTYIRAPGPGGQNVNKLATAVRLRFNVITSPSLPEAVRTRLIALAGNQLNQRGDLIIKATRFRTQERNKQDALTRLQQLIRRAATPRKKRKKTRPTASSMQKRLTTKKHQAKIKALRHKKSTEF